MSGGGGSSTKYKSSKEQQQIMRAALPFIESLGDVGIAQTYQPDQGAPMLGRGLTNIPRPEMYGAAKRPYDVGSYMVGQLPQRPSGMMPTKEWYQSIDPSVKAGLAAPYEDAMQGLKEQMGARGQVGGAGTAWSGTSAAAMGKLASEQARNVGLQAWQMSAPEREARMVEYGAGVQRSRDIGQRNRDVWGAGLERERSVWADERERARQQYAANVRQQELGVRQRMADLDVQREAWRRPMGLLGQVGHAMPTGITEQGQPFSSSVLAPAATGAGIGSYFGPYGALAGGAIGGIAGLVSK
ncbi:MAG: hypothetical protein ACYSTX_00070 [Planctomycetota bacterium]|jgi:hypothetical protein